MNDQSCHLEARSIHERIMSARRAGVGPHSPVADPQKPLPRRRARGIVYAAASALAVLTVGGFGIYQVPIFAEVLAQTTGGQPPATIPAAKPQKPKPKPQSQQQPQPPAQPVGQPSSDPQAADSTDPFVKHAADAGIKTCAATYAGLGKALTGGTQFMVQSQTGKVDANAHSLQGLVGMSFVNGDGSGYSGPAAGLVFAAPTGQGCEGTMVRLVPFQQSCGDAVSLLPQGSRQVQSLAGLSVFRLSTGGQAMLLPSGQGCVAISIVRAGG